MGQLRPLFHLFLSFQTHITNFTTNRCVKKCPSSIWCRYSHSQPLEHESPQDQCSRPDKICLWLRLIVQFYSFRWRSIRSARSTWCTLASPSWGPWPWRTDRKRFSKNIHNLSRTLKNEWRPKCTTRLSTKIIYLTLIGLGSHVSCLDRECCFKGNRQFSDFRWTRKRLSSSSNISWSWSASSVIWKSLKLADDW